MQRNGATTKIVNVVASATLPLKRDLHYRRADWWTLNRVMEAGALGAEIIINGKVRTDRHRFEKFCAGHLPKSGEPARKYMRKVVLHVQLKPECVYLLVG